MTRNIYSLTDIGTKKKNNEDFALVKSCSFFDVLIVCDGVGGQEKGEIASFMCTDYLIDILSRCDKWHIKKSKRLIKYINKSIASINKKIYETAHSSQYYKGMGTTLTLAVITDDLTYVSNVGDSRCYIIKEDKIYQLTEDDTIFNYMMSKGIINPDDQNDGRNNILYQAIGITKVVQPHTRIYKTDYDYLLLCSDGLYKMLNDEQIKSLLLENISIKQKSRILIDNANKNGGLDNIGIALLEVK